MNNYDDRVTEALRDSLARHAAEAPRGDMLAERIIADAEREAVPRHGFRSWPTWTLPLIAAGAVAAVVAAVVGIENFRPSASAPVQPGTEGPSFVQTTPAPVSATTPEPSTQTTVGTSRTASVPPPSGLANVQVTDLTFYGDDTGWALGSADCVNGPGRCTAVLHTTDGQHWAGMPGADFNVPDSQGQCADPCVLHIRFANLDIGYAFGDSAFFMTHDGGQSWQRQPGGAVALETLDDNVIRVTGSGSGCPGPCITGVETAAVGSTDWTASDFPAGAAEFTGGVHLARGNGGDAYVLVTRNPAGGAQDETSTLYRSTDKGQTWQNVGEPCPQTGQEVDSFAIAGGDQGRVSVLCERRMAPPNYRVATSTDAGLHFATQPGEIPGNPGVLAGDPATVLVVAGFGGMARSTDGGATWQHVTDVTGDIGWVGFESTTVGRAVSADGSTIWTTRDGGLTWHAASID